MRSLFLLASAAPLLLANTEPAVVPPAIKAMLDAAIASNNDGEIVTVAKYARTAAPEAAAAIDAQVARWKAAQAARQAALIEHAGPLDLWRGKATVGGSLTTGNTQDIGLSAALDVTRETKAWRHKIQLATDYTESAGKTSREHYLAAYEPNFKFSSRGYIYGAAQFESDRFLGYTDRYSASLGAGLSAVRSSTVKLDLELGPAYRKTDFTDATREDSVAARGSLDFGWKLSRGVNLTQTASAYVQHINSTVSTTTALNAKVIGPLAAQLSYAVQYESMPPVGRVGTDTTSRAALVYSF